MGKLLIETTITTLIGIFIGYLISKIKDYKKKLSDNQVNNIVQNEAIKMLLQNNLTNQYFVYSKDKSIPDYVYKNWINMLKIYEQLGGDDYIHELERRIKEFKIINTNILD